MELNSAFIRDNFERRYYAPSDSMEYYDEENGQWYTVSGTPLRNPSEFLPGDDGCYTPFGDE